MSCLVKTNIILLYADIRLCQGVTSVFSLSVHFIGWLERQHVHHRQRYRRRRSRFEQGVVHGFAHQANPEEYSDSVLASLGLLRLLLVLLRDLNLSLPCTAIYGHVQSRWSIRSEQSVFQEKVLPGYVYQVDVIVLQTHHRTLQAFRCVC